MNTDKENMLVSARNIMRLAGGKLIVKGQGYNRHVILKGANGRSCVVWYPTEPRVHDIELQDLQDALEWVNGKKYLWVRREHENEAEDPELAKQRSKFGYDIW